MTTEATITTAVATVDDAMRKVSLPQEGAAALREAFAPFFQRAHEAALVASLVKPDEPKKARAARLALREIRIGAEKTRKDQKEDSLRRGKAIDGIYNVLDYQIAPLEKALQDIEDAEEIRERTRKDALRQVRSEELRPFMDPAHMALGEMTDEAYALLLSGARTAHQNKLDNEAREAAQRAADERRAAKEKADAEAAATAERARLQAENARLAAAAAEERKAREAAEAKAKKEREAAELLASQERQRLAAAAEAEKRKAEIAQAEVKRLEAEKAAEAKAEKAAIAKAARAPEKAKVTTLAQQVRALPMPALTSPEGAALTVIISEQFAKLAKWLEAEAGKL